MIEPFEPKIAIVVITAHEMLRACLDALLRLDYPKEKMTLIASRMEPRHLSGDPYVNKARNCSKNRRAARLRALQTNAEYFLLVDDDVLLPPHALRTFAEAAVEKKTAARLPDSMRSIFPNSQETVPRRHVLGGYYRILGTRTYACGRWVADNTFLNFDHAREGLRETDLVGLGCAYLSRHVMESVDFEPGTSLVCTSAATGRSLYVGECGAFGNRVAGLGLPMYMCGAVVCEHLPRKNGNAAPAGAQLNPPPAALPMP